MHRLAAILGIAIGLSVAITSAQQPSTSGPYKILKRATVGGEGNWDYIYADVAGRRLYIPRRAPAVPAGAEGPAPASTVHTRLTVFNLDTLEPIGEIDGVGGQGAAVDPKSGHGFTSSRPVTMFDTKTKVLFAACARSGNPPDAMKPQMVILSATDGKILTTLPLAGASDGAAFNPSTMEAFATQGNGMLTIVKETSPTTFEVEQN